MASKPRGPKNLLLLGNLAAFRAKPIEFLMAAARDYGDLPYFKLGPYHAYLMNHPDYVRDIFVTNQGNFTKSRALQRARILLGQGLLTSEGQFHLRQRRMVQPAFHRDRLGGYAAVMSDYAVRLRERWKAGTTLDISAEMMRLTLSVVGKTLFSADVESEAPEIGESLTPVLKMFRMLMMESVDLVSMLLMF
jgi:cytochrome P450